MIHKHHKSKSRPAQTGATKVTTCTNVILIGTTCIPEVSIQHFQSLYLSSTICLFLHLYRLLSWAPDSKSSFPPGVRNDWTEPNWTAPGRELSCFSQTFSHPDLCVAPFGCWIKVDSNHLIWWSLFWWATVALLNTWLQHHVQHTVPAWCVKAMQTAFASEMTFFTDVSWHGKHSCSW